LPSFPRYIQERLDAKDASLANDRSARAKIIRCIFENLLEKVGWLVNIAFSFDYHIN
jgi:hypothetical protein